ncbi:MarR family winged helix-turn-helix transcriptional regulator [Rhodosalinus sp. K401]|uniref:MarR family winged helix-turn-helix transcriptional regulator n=1 Tax=Rhodosalinus sp. K401 TaxID=3239195 RepID=UPI0035268BBC
MISILVNYRARAYPSGMLDLHEMPGHLIRRLHQISVSVFAGAMRRAGHDLTPVQFAALSALARNPGVDQATLAGLIAYDRVTIGGVVDRLEAKGLVERDVSARDRRARVLRPTRAGEALLAEADPVVRALQDEILSGLDPAERTELVRLLRKAAEAGNARSRAPLQDAGRRVGNG